MSSQLSSWVGVSSASVCSVRCCCFWSVSRFKLRFLFCRWLALRQSRMIFFIFLRPCCGFIFESRCIEPIVWPFVFVTLYLRVFLACVFLGIIIRFPLRRGGGFGVFCLPFSSVFSFSFCLCSALRAFLVSVICVIRSYSCAMSFSFFFLYLDSAWAEGFLLYVCMNSVKSVSCRFSLILSIFFALSAWYFFCCV